MECCFSTAGTSPLNFQEHLKHTEHFNAPQLKQSQGSFLGGHNEVRLGRQRKLIYCI